MVGRMSCYDGRYASEARVKCLGSVGTGAQGPEGSGSCSGVKGEVGGRRQGRSAGSAQWEKPAGRWLDDRTSTTVRARFEACRGMM